MDCLSTDLLYNILAFNDSYKSNNPLVNKDCSKIFNKNKFIKDANRIQEWYKSYSYSNEYQIRNIDWANVPKSILIKYYRKYYPKKYLMDYPEFMAKKLCCTDLKDYINENMSPKESRKKIEVINFLNLPEISTIDITIAGW